MRVKLILATGHHAGIQAPLQCGFYMVGRHVECQVRPKSHSVSRRHCLIHNAPDHVSVFDLGSTNGTVVNNRRLEPSEWRLLANGDRLHCGKVAFDVSVSLSSSEHLHRASSTDVGTEPILHGQAWEKFDIVAFLEQEDAAEQNLRYQSIRERHESVTDCPDDEFHIFDEQPVCGHIGTSVDLNRDAQESEANDGFAPSTGSDEQAFDEGQSPRARRIAQIRARIEAARMNQLPPVLSRTTEVVSGPLKAKLDSRVDVTLLALFVLLVVSIGLAGYSGYQMLHHAPVRVLESID